MIYQSLEKNVCIVKCDGEQGTGFLVSNKLILTAYHIVNKCSKNVIKVFFGEVESSVVLHSSIEDKHKALDIAILELENPVEKYNHIELVDTVLKPSMKWISRGYPKSKLSTGENILIDTRNCVNQQLKILNDMNDIQLDFTKKLNTYEGFSGSPLIIENSIVGIIKSELLEQGEAKELYGLSIKYFSDLLECLDILITKSEINIDKIKQDGTSSLAWSDIKPADRVRNLTDKLRNVCQDISEVRIEQYSRLVAIGKIEQNNYNEQHISAIKYIIFEECQDELISFFENNKDNEDLSITEIRDFLTKYLNRAKEIIADRRKEHYYPELSDDLLRKIILDLIDGCYLSFDKDGIYEE